MKSKMETSTDKPTCVRVAIILLLLLVASARAEIKKFMFQGTIGLVEDQGVLDGSVTNGAAFEGLYVFDTSFKNSNPNSDPTVGDYWYTNSAFGLVIKVGNFVFRTDPANVDFLIEVVNRPGQDNYLLLSRNNVCSQRVNVCSQPLLIGYISWQLDDSTGRALTNAVLPVTPPTLSAWQSVFGLNVYGAGFSLRGTVSSISEALVAAPEQFPISLGDAFEVKWLSRSGTFYQLQSSEDLVTWTDVGESVLGDGTMLSKFFAQQSGKSVSYRAAIADFPR
jgi:hypothetical protein